ncbi:MAG TPA: zf-HC2 domain-containing protein, partial [Pyrinomonadaceae bacterium]|nr:zf-HC2 domain-containing protein [Pyrinomonadaceae bacterium]
RQEKICERNLIAAYVDGELETDVTALFEEHLESCPSCRAELRAHRLFVCELDAALTETGEIPVPAEFSRMVAARASSDMRGVRTRSENRKALGICLILALAGFALLGATARDAIFMIAEKFVSTFFSVVGFISTVVYDTVAGLAVIFRVLSRKIIIESGSLGPVLVLLAVAILILSRMIHNYHRTSATE